MDSKSIGSSGDRIIAAGMINFVKEYGTDWGWMTDVRFHDDNGAHVRWKASQRLYLVVGDWISVRATIAGYRKVEGEGDVLCHITNGRVLEGALF